MDLALTDELYAHTLMSMEKYWLEGLVAVSFSKLICLEYDVDMNLRWRKMSIEFWKWIQFASYRKETREKPFRIDRGNSFLFIAQSMWNMSLNNRQPSPLLYRLISSKSYMVTSCPPPSLSLSSLSCILSHEVSPVINHKQEPMCISGTLIGLGAKPPTSVLSPGERFSLAEDIYWGQETRKLC